MSTAKTTAAPPSVRRFTQPRAGEEWEALAERAAGTDVITLQSWNTHLAMRPAPFAITPTDIIFVEPPHQPVDAS